MRDLAMMVNSSDLRITDFDLVFTQDLPELVAQRLRIRLSWFKGEYFQNIDLGVPYFQTIFEKGSNPILTQAELKRAITETEGVESLLRFTITPKDNREVQINFLVKCTDGTLLDLEV